MKHCYELLSHHATADPYLCVQLYFPLSCFPFKKTKHVCVAWVSTQSLTKNTSPTLIYQLTLSTHSWSWSTPVYSFLRCCSRWNRLCECLLVRKKKWSSWALLSLRFLCAHTLEWNVKSCRTTLLHN